MATDIDPKGKRFTDVISKHAVAVLLQTTTHMISGNIHVRNEFRLKDELDLGESFLAVTDAAVSTPDGKILFQSKFLAVQRKQIVWVYEKEKEPIS